MILTRLFPHFFLTVAKMSLPKRSAPYLSNPPFLFFLTFGHSGPNVKNSGQADTFSVFAFRTLHVF